VIAQDRPATAQPLFAREIFQRVAGETLRPGGLALTRRALDLTTLPPGATVLDLGCGRGATARLLAEYGFAVLALDASREFLSTARAPGVAPLLARAEALPLAARSVDAVFCECVLSVTGQPRTVLAEAARVLKPGGPLVLSDVYLRQANDAAADGGDCLSGALPWSELVAHLAWAGFAVELFEDHSRLLVELAGQLILAGMPAAELGRCDAQPCARPGYFLCLARRRQR